MVPKQNVTDKQKHWYSHTQFNNKVVIKITTSVCTYHDIVYKQQTGKKFCTFSSGCDFLGQACNDTARSIMLVQSMRQFCTDNKQLDCQPPLQLIN